MTFLSLDASNREHRFARHVDHFAAERQADHRVIGQAELAAAEERPLGNTGSQRKSVTAERTWRIALTLHRKYAVYRRPADAKCFGNRAGRFSAGVHPLSESRFRVVERLRSGNKVVYAAGVAQNLYRVILELV